MTITASASLERRPQRRNCDEAILMFDARNRSRRASKAFILQNMPAAAIAPKSSTNADNVCAAAPRHKALARPVTRAISAGYGHSLSCDRVLRLFAPSGVATFAAPRQVKALPAGITWRRPAIDPELNRQPTLKVKNRNSCAITGIACENSCHPGHHVQRICRPAGRYQRKLEMAFAQQGANGRGGRKTEWEPGCRHDD